MWPMGHSLLTCTRMPSALSSCTGISLQSKADRTKARRQPGKHLGGISASRGFQLPCSLYYEMKWIVMVATRARTKSNCPCEAKYGEVN